MVLFLIVVLLWAGPGLSFFVKWEWVGGGSSKFFQHSNVLREHPRYFNVSASSQLLESDFKKYLPSMNF